MTKEVSQETIKKNNNFSDLLIQRLQTNRKVMKETLENEVGLIASSIDDLAFPLQSSSVLFDTKSRYQPTLSPPLRLVKITHVT